MSKRKFPTISSFISYLQEGARHIQVRTDLPAWEEAQRLAVSLYGVSHVSQNPALVDYACLAVSMLDKPMFMKVDARIAAEARRINPGPLPDRPPKLLSGAWIIEMHDSSKGDRLFADTASLGGYLQQPSGDIVLIGRVEADGSGHIAPWRPEWGKADAASGIRREVSPLIADPDGYYVWARQAAQFALGWAMMLELTDPPMRSSVDRGETAGISRHWN